jgi:hypothetical protein
MPRIFLSHASDDVERIRPLADALRAEGYDLWWDGDLQAGQRYMEVIAKELREADCAVVCWSQSALAPGRDWVRGEAEFARAYLIPVLLEEVELPPPFNMLHALRLFSWGGDRSHPTFQGLLGGIRTKIEERISNPPRSVSNGSRRKALLVGVGSYAGDSKLVSLSAPLGNVEQLARVLRLEACGFEVTPLRNVSKQELEVALDSFFTGARADELLFFYFSGHTPLIDAAGLHLTGRDSKVDSYRSTAMALSRFERDFLAPCKAQHIVLCFDACYGSAPAAAVAASFQSTLGAGRSLVVIASESNPSAGPTPFQEKQSSLTTSLIRTIDSEVADSNHDGIVTVEEIAHYLAPSDDPAAPGAARYWSFLSTPSQIEIRRKKGRASDNLTLSDEQAQFVKVFASELEQGKIIPFLGDGIYGSGKLSFFRVARALAEAAGLSGEKRQDMIATAAESLELHAEDRGEFLGLLTALFASQAAGIESPAVHDLILEMKPPWLVVSVNYDDLLESRLTAEGRPYVIISHVLRSGDADDPASCDKHAGKILVQRSPHHPAVQNDASKAVELLSAQNVALAEDDCVIYKLLGSACLQALPFAKQEKLDSVVITESDHVDFLVHLRETSTGVPSAISTRLRMGKLLFLEYNLDVWHYRLIGHLFRTNAATRTRPGSVLLKKTPYKLRTASSPTEDLFWKRRFNPDKVPLDLATFVRAVRAARGE